MTDRYEKIRKALAHEIWAAAQLAPGEGIVDGVARIAALLRKAAYPVIIQCGGCRCDRLGASATGAGQAEIEALRETLEALERARERLEIGRNKA